MKTRTWTRLIALAGILTLGGAASASLLDATVLIERAANNRTLTVRYNGASAALVELRINGQSSATRLVDDKASRGETSFAIDTAALEDGDNTIEIRLYNADGKVIGSEKSTFLVDRKGTGPAFLEKPRAGATVQGPVEIKLGLRQEMRNIYVSFFINDEFKMMRNFPPFAYLWDTERERNGWHEVQAWVIDETNNTYKTEKLRLFVNNPTGRTNRTGGERATLTAGSPVGTVQPSGLKGAPAPTGSPAPAGSQSIAPVAGTAKPVATAAPQPRLSANQVRPSTVQPAGTKGAAPAPGHALGAQNINPGRSLPEPVKVIADGVGQFVATSAGGGGQIISTAGAAGMGPMAIGFGSRLPHTGAFQIMLEGRYVNFDVSPRVHDGIPITPFRHLFQEAGGIVFWNHSAKEVTAAGRGQNVWFRVGSDIAQINGRGARFELSPFIESGRVLVPLSFMVDALKVNVQYDPNTGHVLVSSQGPEKR